MAAFPNLVLTNAGIALQNKVQGGAVLELTNIQMGSGQLNGQPIGPLTALISSNATVPIQGGQAIGQNTYQVEGFFTNADLSAGFWWREIGIFANDPDNGEILYAYANAGDAGDYIPTVTDQRIEKYIYFSMALANATTVNVTIPQTDTFVLKTEVGQPNGVAGLDENGAVPIKQGGTGETTAQGALTALGAMAADATGADIPVSSSDQTSISASLSNKVAQLGSISAELFDDPTYSNGYFASVEDVTDPKPNIPAPGHWRLLYLPYFAASEGWSTQIAVGAVENSGLCWRKASGTKWKPWEFAAIAKPPQVRNLTLQPGFTANSDCTFFVTQESAVFLAGGVSGTLPANQDTQIGTLPADAKPVEKRRRPAVTNAGTAYIDIHTDGTVWAHPFAAASQCWFDTSFVAGGGS